MKTVEITLYKFNELSETARQKAIDANREINISYGWYEPLIDEFKQDAPNWLEVEDVYFSGFGRQGDGACFTGEIDVDKYLRAHKLRSKYRAADGNILILKDSRWHHEYAVDVDAEEENVPDVLLQHVVSTVRGMARTLYKNLQDEYFYQTSDDAIADTLVINDYLFRADGRLTNEKGE